MLFWNNFFLEQYNRWRNNKYSEIGFTLNFFVRSKTKKNHPKNKKKVYLTFSFRLFYSPAFCGAFQFCYVRSLSKNKNKKTYT